MEPKEIYHSLIRLHILLDAAKGPIESGGVAGKLNVLGFTANLASVRQILRTLESRGYLLSNEVHNSRARRMYRITQAGRLRARDAKKKIGDLIEIFESQGA
jgi:DNA-binding PadR family transcriptional regulator